MEKSLQIASSPVVESTKSGVVSCKKHCSLGRILSFVFIYFAAGGLSLLVAQIPGDIGEGLCGVWGCFPPIQSLISMHLLWCVVAAATVHWLTTRNPGDVRLEGSVLMLISGLAIGWVVGRDLTQWMSWMSAEHAAYWPRRIAYTLATHSDWPFVPMFMAGIVCYGIAMRRRSLRNSKIHWEISPDARTIDAH